MVAWSWLEGPVGAYAAAALGFEPSVSGPGRYAPTLGKAPNAGAAEGTNRFDPRRFLKT